MRLICLLPLVLCACDIAEDRFDDVVAERWCARQKSCDEDVFFKEWLLGTPDCRAAIADHVDDKRYGNGNAACTYSSDEASACLSQVQDAKCEDLLATSFVDQCTQDVWDCISIVDPGAP